MFQLGDELQLLDLGTGESRVINVTIPGARPALRPQAVEAGENLAGGSISSTGKRAVIEARGDIWTVPAENGPIRQITDTSGAAERSPAWSPDGRWIAYFSDADGEYELYVTQSDGKGETRQLTDGNENFFYSITWSPDSESMLVVDKAGRLLLVDTETGEMTEIDRDPWGNQPGVSWSGDSRWITWARAEEETLSSSIWMYDTETGEKHKLTSGFFSDDSPVFSRDGEYLYYTSSRRFENPQYEDVGSTFVYANTGVLIAVPLTDEVENPWLIESDEETWEEETEEGEESADEQGDAEGGDEGDAENDAESDEESDANESLVRGPRHRAPAVRRVGRHGGRLLGARHARRRDDLHDGDRCRQRRQHLGHIRIAGRDEQSGRCRSVGRRDERVVHRAFAKQHHSCQPGHSRWRHDHRHVGDRGDGRVGHVGGDAHDARDR
ncbi:MAG: hypothetical protein AAFR76_07375 [Planctomycetota bacterium]